jgi:hypothetical protein
VKHNWGSKSWGCLVLSLVAACGQDAAQQPVDLADASAVRDARERIDDRPALRLPSMRPQVEDPRELVLGRVAPVDARLVSGEPTTLWSCVDSNPATRLDDVRSALEFDVVFGRLEQLSELRLAGPARGTLSVRSRDGDAIEGWRSIDVSLAESEERLVAARAPVGARTVRVRWTPADGSHSVPELEWRALVRSSSLAAPTRLADGLLAQERSGVLRLRSTAPSSIVRISSQPGLPESAIHVPVDFDPARCDRAFLHYDLNGAAHWTAVAYRIGTVPSARPLSATRTGPSDERSEAGLSLSEN